MTSIDGFEIPKHFHSAFTKASKLTGADFDYLLKTAARESSFRPSVKSKTSSASGLFQFIESTWLKTIKEDGGKYNLGMYAKYISKDAKGHYTVSQPQMREKILALRDDPEVSAVMAGAYAKANAKYIQNKIGREPSSGEVYVAHFLGPKDAVRMIRLSELQPKADADVFFAQAAKKNKNIFYNNGNSLSVKEVYQKLVTQHSGGSSKTLSSDVIGAWQVQVLPENKSVEPLVAKANFKAGNVKSGTGSIGVWGNIGGVSADDKEAASPSNSKRNITGLYQKK